MSVVIKSMKMPRTCDECNLYHYFEDYRRGLCYVVRKFHDDKFFKWESGNRNKPLNCPLEELRDV